MQLLLDLIEKPAVHEKMQSALAQWHAPHAAEQIAEAMLAAVGAGAGEGCRAESPFGSSTGLPNCGAGRQSKALRAPASRPLADSAHNGYQDAAAGREGRLSQHDAILENAGQRGAAGSE